jgi:hypothetical protein
VWPLLLLAAGCATDPYAQLETTTPALTTAEVADLQKTSRTPEELGIQMRLTPQSAAFGRVNQVSAEADVTVPLFKVPTDNPREPGGSYRVPIIFGAVDGQENIRILLDSGSNRNLLGYSLAHSLAIPTVTGVKPITAIAIGGAVDNYLAVVPKLRIGSVEFKRMLALIGPDAQALSLTRGFWGDTQIMILGVNALRGLSYLSIDYLHGNATLGAHEAYLTDPASTFVTAIPLRWQSELPMVDITIDKRTTYPCILDTGGDYGLLVPRGRGMELGYWQPGKGELNTSRGVGGSALDTRYEVREAKLGDAALMRIPSRTQLIGPEPAGGQFLVGNVVLRRYRVTFDFKRSVVWLER